MEVREPVTEIISCSMNRSVCKCSLCEVLGDVIEFFLNGALAVGLGIFQYLQLILESMLLYYSCIPLDTTLGPTSTAFALADVAHSERIKTIQCDKSIK